MKRVLFALSLSFLCTFVTAQTPNNVTRYKITRESRAQITDGEWSPWSKWSRTMHFYIDVTWDRENNTGTIFFSADRLADGGVCRLKALDSATRLADGSMLCIYSCQDNRKAYIKQVTDGSLFFAFVYGNWAVCFAGR